MNNGFNLRVYVLTSLDIGKRKFAPHWSYDLIVYDIGAKRSFTYNEASL